MAATKKYKFSFTATSLRTKDFVQVALRETSKNTDETILFLGNGKSSTGKRLLMEFNKWLSVLTESQLELLKTGSFKTQNEITFLAVCKYYGFIRDFITEVLREKYLVYDYELSDGDYISFYRRKAEYYPEMEDLTEVTQKKVRQVTFKILEQAGLINNIKSKMIQPQIIEPQTKKVILKDNSELLKIFLYSDFDIQTLTA